MKSSLRWYGDSDPVTLEYIRQIPGMRSIVSAVYDVKPGEVWPEESIKHIADECSANGLVFDVVESIPVTEDIKLGTKERDRHIDNYCESIRRCAKYGVKCVTYNFMPVFDWTRTQLDKAAEDGSTSLVMYWEQLKGLDPLKEDIHLPGWDSSYTQDEVRELIKQYSELGEEGLWENIEYFLTIAGISFLGEQPSEPVQKHNVFDGLSTIERYLSIFSSQVITLGSPNIGYGGSSG